MLWSAGMSHAVESSPAPVNGLARLRAEFALFYVGAPLVVALFLPPRWMCPVLGLMTLVGFLLLAATPGFRWSELVRGATRIGWHRVWAVVLGTLLLGLFILDAAVPRHLWLMAHRNPSLMLAIALFYPVISALPQEVLFRVLFFRRYGPILPRQTFAAVLLNAAIFSFAHLMYWSWIVAGMTFAGGLAFAYSYRVRGNFPEAVVVHSLAGLVIFALGLGVFFYSGNVTRPF